MRNHLKFGFIILIITNVVTTKFLDLTHKLHNGIPIYPGLLTPFQLIQVTNGTQPGGYWFQTEDIMTTVHCGTHLDAPCHFSSGKWRIDEIPFERFILPAAVIDITEKAAQDADALLLVEDLENWEYLYGKIPDGSIVILRTGWSKYWTDPEKYLGTSTNDSTKLHFPGVSPEAAQWLVDNRDIYACGVETISLDYGQDIRFQAHTILLSANIYAIENMANVDKLPILGATIYAMPINIKEGSGAPGRVSAQLADDI